MKRDDFTHEAALITGASSGIGAELAHLLAPDFACLVLVARRSNLLEELAETIRDRHPHVRVECLVADVAEFDRFQHDLRACLERVPPLYLAIFNAGIGRRTDAGEAHLGKCIQVLNTNFLAAVAGVDTVLPSMRSRGRGQIVFINSLAAYRGLPHAGPYSASKAALWKYAESLRAELWTSGISVTSIHPGFVHTEMTRKNRHAMPFILSSKRAARLISGAIYRRKAHYSFPWMYRWMFYLIRIIPESIFPRLVKNRK